MNQKKSEPKSSKIKTKSRPITKIHSENKLPAHKEVLNKTIDIIYTKMIQSKNTQNYTWKRSFIDLLEKEKGIDIKQADSTPKSINEVGSMAMKNYKFWILYLEYMKRSLSFAKLLRVTRCGISLLSKTKEIQMMKILFAAMIKELKVSDREIEHYCKANGIKQKTRDKYYDYLLFNGFCNTDKGEEVKKKSKKDGNDNNASLGDCKGKKEGKEDADEQCNANIVKNGIIKQEQNTNDPISIPLYITAQKMKAEITPILETNLESSPLTKVINERSICEDIEKIKSVLKSDKEIKVQLTSPPKQITDCDLTPKHNPLIEHNIYDRTQSQVDESNNKSKLNETTMNASFDQKKYFSFNDVSYDSAKKNASKAENEDNSIEDSYIKYLKEVAAQRSNEVNLLMNFNIDDSINNSIENPIDKTDQIGLFTPKVIRKSLRLIEALLLPSNSNSQRSEGKVHIFRFKYNVK